MPTFSRDLEQALHRALAFANELHHEYATLEHLLLALIDDQDAADVMRACDVDLSKLRGRLRAYIESELDSLKTDYADDSKPTAGFQRVIQRAVIHAQSSNLDVVNGANTLVAIFAESESEAVEILHEFNFTRFAAVSYITNGIRRGVKYLSDVVEPSIARSAELAPSFQAYRGKIRFRQAPANRRIAERKAAARERCTELQRRCSSRANEQPELKLLADRYSAALQMLRKDRGAYKLFIIGMELEILLKTKADAPPDLDRNPHLDSDLLFAARSLIVAHAGLITLFPDARQTAQELDRYRRMAEGLDTFRDRVLDPIIDQLAEARGIFDEQTQEITQEIKAVGNLEGAVGGPPSQGTTAMKHGWLRGALASIGQYLLKQIKEGAKGARDAAIKTATSELVKHPDSLTAAILTFIRGSKEALATLAIQLPTVFGWIEFLLSLFK